MKTISTKNAPAAIGPYVQAIKAGDFLFLSGQIPLDPSTMQIVAGGIEAQTRQCFNNVKNVLKAENLTLENVCKVTVYLDDINEFNAMNEVYGEFFIVHKPARSAVQVGKLPKNAKVEIEVVAYCK